MFQGTGSDVGKSLVVSGLCRALANRGLRVLPFKPQNMSNNAAVTPDGGEIGRAQALQATACRAIPSVHMNPILLKPQSEIGAQVVILGKVLCQATAIEYQKLKPALLKTVLSSFNRLKSESEIVIVEGAGSSAETNLRINDIANMGFASAAQVPVVLIGDIDRGGVIAQIAGTQIVIDRADSAMIAGFLVNKFRGDPALFQSGMESIVRHTGWKGLGVIPFFQKAKRLPAEDALVLNGYKTRHDGTCTVVVPRLPHIANFDDLDPLLLEPALRLLIVEPGQVLPSNADLIIIPGSKATRSDLAVLRQTGWDIDLAAHVRRGGKVLGICGGYQMLGKLVADPDGVEGFPGTTQGLGFLDVHTVLTREKTLTEVNGTSWADAVPFRGYEMHAGRTTGPDTAFPMLRMADGRLDGARSRDGQIYGTYVHGLFRDERQRSALLTWFGSSSSGELYDAGVDQTLDELADHLSASIDLTSLLKLAR
jgi:adenosylcobyric acid synthase